MLGYFLFVLSRGSIVNYRGICGLRGIGDFLILIIKGFIPFAALSSEL